MATWLTGAQWLDDDGQPRPLSRLARSDKDASFEALVTSVSQDIRPRSILDEWLRLGVVRINDVDEIILISNGFIPKEGLEEKLAYYGHNLGDSQQSTEQTECESMKRFTCGVYFYSSDTSEAPQKK